MQVYMVRNTYVSCAFLHRGRLEVAHSFRDDGARACDNPIPRFGKMARIRV